MSKQTTNAGKAPSKSAEKNFTWTDEETALLVQVIIDYKAAKISKGLELETIKNKYEEITKNFIERYPRSEDGVRTEEFPNTMDPSIFTKDRVAPKIKRIKTSFRKAVDRGRRSGGGRIVMALYDECYEIWAGSPAVESIQEGIESSSSDYSSATCDLQTEQSSSYCESQSPIESEENDELDEGEAEEPCPSKKPSSRKNMAEARRSLLSNLREKKDGKLTKRLSTDAQLLDTAKQEIALKKRGIEMIEEADKKHKETMQKFSESVNTLSAVIGNGFMMLQGLLQKPTFYQEAQPTNFFQNQNHRGQRNTSAGFEQRDQPSYQRFLDEDNF